MRVWERSCVLHSVAKEEKDMSSKICWMPSGSIIASSNKKQIIFFERNALRHYEFDLRETEDFEVLKIEWNCGSDLLAILLKSSSTNRKTIQLWTRRNYHWYLKQHLLVNNEINTKLSQMCWDVEDPMLLRVLFQDGSIFRYNFCWDYISSQTISKKNPCNVAVIDGSNSFSFY